MKNFTYVEEQISSTDLYGESKRPVTRVAWELWSVDYIGWQDTLRQKGEEQARNPRVGTVQWGIKLKIKCLYENV